MISATTAATTADEEVIACHDDMMLTQRRCGAELFKRLQELFALRKLSAAEFCELNYWCNGANVPGADFAKYSKPPGQQTGTYQRFLDQHMHVEMASHDLHVPCTRSFGAGRTSKVKQDSQKESIESDEEEETCGDLWQDAKEEIEELVEEIATRLSKKSQEDATAATTPTTAAPTRL